MTLHGTGVPDAEVAIRRLRPGDGPACDAVIFSLPYHFGHEGGRRDCAAAVRASDGLVALVQDRLVGFLTVTRHYKTSAEITWMAVQMEHRGRGIGHALIEQLVAELRAEGRQLLLVATLAESADEGDRVDSYARTRAFYQSVGFIAARDVPLWDDPAVLFVMPIAGSSDASCLLERDVRKPPRGQER